MLTLSIRFLAAVALAFTLVLAGCQPADQPAATSPRSTTTAPPAARTDAAPQRPRPADVPVRSATQSPRDAAPAPVRVEASDLGMSIGVIPVGVADDGQMVVPDDARTAGWYEYGPIPGAVEGTAVIAAHVDSVAAGGLGPFARLAKIRRGDVVTTTDAAGRTTTFEVVRVEQVAKPEIDWHDVFTRDGEPRLVLITCGGNWNSDARHYSDNVVVIAVPRA